MVSIRDYKPSMNEKQLTEYIGRMAVEYYKIGQSTEQLDKDLITHGYTYEKNWFNVTTNAAIHQYDLNIVVQGMRGDTRIFSDLLKREYKYSDNPYSYHAGIEVLNAQGEKVGEFWLWTHTGSAMSKDWLAGYLVGKAEECMAEAPVDFGEFIYDTGSYSAPKSTIE
jgi:hypothetical protein